MCLINITSLIVKYTSSIIFKFLSNSYTTRNWSSLVNFINHGIFPWNWPIFVYLIYKVLSYRATRFSWACSTPEKVSALKSICPSFSLVDAACFISNIIFMHKFVCQSIISSLAAIIISLVITWQQILRRNVYIWPLSISCYLNSIRKNSSCCKCPRWSAVSWHILLPH